MYLIINLCASCQLSGSVIYCGVHRVANYNTGPWESWEFSPQGLVNSKWDKDLGFEVHEVNVVAREALEWSETLNKNYAQHLMQQVKSTHQPYSKPLLF